MIKFKNIVNEEFRGFNKGKDFKLDNPVIDPETNSSISDVTYLPRFLEMRRMVKKLQEQVRVYSFSTDPTILDLVKALTKSLGLAQKQLVTLERLVNLNKNGERH